MFEMKQLLILILLFINACSFVEQSPGGNMSRMYKGAETDSRIYDGGKHPFYVKLSGSINAQSPDLSEANFNEIEVKFLGEKGEIISTSYLPDEAVAEISAYLRFRLAVCHSNEYKKPTAQKMMDDDILGTRASARLQVRLKIGSTSC